MGATGSELKRVHQSQKENRRNRHYKSMMKTAIKKVLTAGKKEAPQVLSHAVSIIDRVYSKGVIHKNRAARQKSKLTKHVNSL